tara:strand:+ start:1404 stop:1958 length:555 start_codon:yes stop_codon:yes gene_type:complete
MAEKHILSLEVPLVTNCGLMTIMDKSVYTDNLPVDCPELLVTPPGFNSPILFKLQKGFSINITACNLNFQLEDCGNSLGSIPDGVYVLRYSVAPNDKVYVEYNHLRITNITNLYYNVLCEININDCEPHSERKDLINELEYIKLLIDAAISNVEYCISPGKGMDLYNYAYKRLHKISCTYGVCV